MRLGGLAALYPVVRLYAWHAGRALLDGCDSWVPQTPQFRARVLFSLPGVLLVFWRLAACPERANLLPPTTAGGRRLCHRCGRSGTVDVPRAVAAPAHGIRGHPRFASG